MTSFYEEIRKNDSISDEKENAQSRANVDKWIFRLLLFLIGFMPLIVLANVEEVISPLVSNVDLLASGMKGELFTHFKSLILLIITITVSVLLLIKILFMNGTIKKTPFNFLIGAFIVAILISALFSPNSTIALFGQYNRSDGVISWVCYMAIVFVALNIKYPKSVMQYILYVLLPFIYLNFIIITMNFYGKDLLQYQAIQKGISMLLPSGASIGTDSQLIGTLNQWNYMSGMFAIMTTIYLLWAVIAKTLKETTIALVTACIAWAITLMALSANGFVTFISMLVIILFIVFKTLNKKKAILVLFIFLLVGAGSLHILASKNEKVWAESIGFVFSGTNPYTKVPPEATSGQPVLESVVRLLDNKAYASDNVFELPVLPEAAWGPGTGRIYIWQKSIELVKDRPILGYGMDSLMYHFPHNDIEAQGNLNEVTIVDKPHNIYVGILFGAGLLGFVIFIGFVAFTLKDTVRTIWNFKNNSEYTVILFVAWLAFLVQALFNDSTLGIAGPLFALVGIGLGIVQQNNTKLEKENI